MSQTVQGQEPTYQEASGRQFEPGEIIVGLKEPDAQSDLRALT